MLSPPSETRSHKRVAIIQIKEKKKKKDYFPPPDLSVMSDLAS